MTNWRSIPLAGVPAVLVALAVLVLGVVILVLAARSSRRRRGWRVSGRVVAGVGVLATVAVVANSAVGAFPTVGDVVPLSRIPRLADVDTGSRASREQGAEARIQVPDTASQFGTFDAYVWLPPEYFTQPDRRFPMAILLAGNPGRSSDWLQHGSAASTGLGVAQSGHPVILVMPTVLRTPDSDSLCVDTESQGHAATYVVQDVVAAADTQLRTVADAWHRVIGGFSMGGFCALNLGLQHPDVFSVVVSFSSLTVCQPDAIQGGNKALFGSSDWKEKVRQNSPWEYYQDLDPARGPALWLEAGDDEELTQPLEDFASALTDRGFTVEYRTRPGGHTFETWTPALQEALPWAAARVS